MLGLVRHRALVAVDALIRLDGHPCIVMERVDGASLDDLLAPAGPLPAPAALEVIAEVAAALSAAWHTEVDGRPLRLLHRDVKPSNVLVTAAGDVKLLDFGVARAEFDTREARTREVLYGSPAYMSPERLELVDSAAGDVFALGVTLGEIASGARATAVTARPAQHEERIAALLAAADPALRDLLARTTAWDPQDRPDAETVAAEARALAEHLPGQRLRDWTSARVPAATAFRRASAGELTGRTLAEESDAVHVDPSATWEEFELPRPSATVDLPVVPWIDPPRRRWWPWALLVAGGGGVSVVAAIVVTSVVAVALVVAAIWPSVSRIGCASMATDMERKLAAAVAPRAARDLPPRARAACLRGELGLLGADVLLLHVQAATDDGAVDAADLVDLADAFDRLIPPP